MKEQHRTIRTLLTTMAPRRAADYIRSFDLPEEEELFLMECDVRRKSCTQAALEHHTTAEVVKRRKRSGYAHIADAIDHQ